MAQSKKYMAQISKIKAVDKEKFTVDAVISDESIDRHGENILISAWSKASLNRYKKHPILLSSHDHTNLRSQIGQLGLGLGTGNHLPILSLR